MRPVVSKPPSRSRLLLLSVFDSVLTACFLSLVHSVCEQPELLKGLSCPWCLMPVFLAEGVMVAFMSEILPHQLKGQRGPGVQQV